MKAAAPEVARWGFFCRGCTGVHVSNSERPATDQAFEESVKAIIGRIGALMSIRGKNAPGAERAGLLSCGHALHCLAVRFLKPHDQWPGREHENFPPEVTNGWAVQWYADYLEAWEAHVVSLQDAVRAGRIKLRTFHRTFVEEAKVRAWCESDPWPKRPEDYKLFRHCSRWDRFMGNEWPDRQGLPPGAVDPTEWRKWLEETGIGTTDIKQTTEERSGAAKGKGWMTLVEQPPMTHVITKKKRRDALAPVIEDAQKEAKNPTDSAEVFNTLKQWASSGERRPPLNGITEDGKVMWLDSNDKSRELSRDALRKRIGA